MTMIAMIAHHRQSLYPFKPMFFEDLYEKEKGNFVVDMVKPLVNIPGRIVITDARLYFQPFSNAFSATEILKWKLQTIKQAICRTYLLNSTGLEVFMKDSNEANFFVFDCEESRNNLLEILSKQDYVDLVDSKQSNMTLKWQNGAISNYEYLLYLNNEANRTFNNLSQYPVFPWVLADYQSKTLNLNDPVTFRDLSKPVGALNEKRLNNILERYQDMPEPRFMYGSHYSTPGFVTYFLVRDKPDYMLCIQNGKFDHPDRLFTDVQETWNCVISNAADFKELIPEFYKGDGSFLMNNLKLKLGQRQNGNLVNDVILPPWADNPKDFIKKMREALESDYVSSNLHNWIDLIFGYKQQGPISVQSHNVFHHLAYPGSVDISAIQDLNDRQSVITQILEFGQVPAQMFSKAHPERKRLSVPLPLQIKQVVKEDVVEEIEFSQNSSLCVSEELDLASYLDLDLIKIKDHATFFIHCHQHDLILIGTSSGFLYVYKFSDMSYVMSVIVSKASLTCALDYIDTVIIGGEDGKFYIFSKGQTRVYLTLSGHYNTISDLKNSSDLFFSSSLDSTVKLWSVVSQSGKVTKLSLVNEFDHDGEIVSIAVEGPWLLSCMRDGTILAWDWDSADIIHTLDYTHGDISRVMVWNNKVILLGLQIFLLELETFEEKFSKRLDNQVTSSHRVLDDKLLLGDSVGCVIMFDLVEERVVGEVVGSVGKVYAVMCEGEWLLLGNNKSVSVKKRHY